MSAAAKAERPDGGRGWLLAAGAISVALAGFAGVLWYAYSVGTRDSGAPLLTADQAPIKVKPDAPGGLTPQLPEMAVYGLGRPQPVAPAPGGERLLPPPEAPLARPAPEPEPQVAAQPPTPPADAARAAQELRDLINKVLTDPPAAGPTPQIAQAPAAPAPPSVAAPPAARTPGLIGATPPAPRAPPPAAATRPGAYRVQLVSLTSEEAARQAWSKARADYGDLLAGLEGAVVPATLPDKRTVWRVQVGPLASRAAADTLCGSLRARKSTCLVLAP